MNRVQLDFNSWGPVVFGGHLRQRERWRWRGPGVPRVPQVAPTQTTFNQAFRGGSG